MIILHVYTKNGRLSQVYVALHTMDSSKDGKLHFIDQIYFLIVRVIICYFFKLLLQKAGLQYLFFSCDCSSVRFCNNFVWSTLGEPLSLKCMERFGYEVIEDVKQPYLIGSEELKPILREPMCVVRNHPMLCPDSDFNRICQDHDSACTYHSFHPITLIQGLTLERSIYTTTPKAHYYALLKKLRLV